MPDTCTGSFQVATTFDPWQHHFGVPTPARATTVRVTTGATQMAPPATAVRLSSWRLDVRTSSSCTAANRTTGWGP